MSTTAVADLDIERLVHIDRQIDANESTALRARWEFGQQMLAARDGMGRLPNGYLAQLVERTGKSRAELGFRVQFAATYPTEQELSKALDSCGSWTEAIRSLKATRDAEDNIPPEPVPVPTGKFATFVADPPWRVLVSVNEVTISGDRQSGKTEALVALTASLLQKGTSVLYVSQDMKLATEALRRLASLTRNDPAYVARFSNGTESVGHQSGRPCRLRLLPLGARARILLRHLNSGRRRRLRARRSFRRIRLPSTRGRGGLMTQMCKRRFGDGSRWRIRNHPATNSWYVYAPSAVPGRNQLYDQSAGRFPTFEHARAAFATGGDYRVKAEDVDAWMESRAYEPIRRGA